jgi:hypothetical protein
MAKDLYRVPYGKGELAFRLPPGLRGHLVTSRPVPPVATPSGWAVGSAAG